MVSVVPVRSNDAFEDLPTNPIVVVGTKNKIQYILVRLHLRRTEA